MGEYEKRGYLQENFRLFHLRSEQPLQVDFHYHEFCKLLLLVSGSGCYVVDGHRYRLQAGDAVLIGSHSVHRPEINPSVPYERIIIFISPEYLQRQSVDGGTLQDCFFRKKPVLRLPEHRRKKIFSLTEALEKELGSGEYATEIASHAALLRLLVQIGREQLRADVLTPAPEAAQDSRITALMQYIDTHLEEDLDIDRLAEQFYISKYHMMRLFRRETGSTIYTYLSQRRLLHARALIGSGMRATEACYRSGFRSYSSFTRAFSKHFHTTPTGRYEALSQPMTDWE